jgi:multidrug efflux pump
MRFSDIFIRRPVLTSMLSLGLILFGIIGYTRLAVREYPDVDAPVVSVTTLLPGANPQVVESAVTDVLEEELASVEGLRTLTSASAEERSTITVEFTLDRNVEDAAQDVRDKVARVRGELPEDVQEPVVAKQEADATPFMFLALTADSLATRPLDLIALSDLADRQVKTRLQTIPGVSSATIFGERRLAMRVWLTPAEMAARGLTVQDVEAAIRSRSVEVPAGRVESAQREFSVRSLGELRTPAEFAELTVAPQGGQLTRLKDLGRVEFGPADDRTALRYNGAPGVAIGIVRQSKANVIEVADAVRAQLPAIQASLPKGVTLTLAVDNSVFVTRSITEAQETLYITMGLVVVIIFVFLRTLRATLIPALAIPVSIVASFGLMYVLGFSLNSVTLLALILAIGLVVDDAIIVLENAYRRQEELGEDPETAATRGTDEIATAVVATTIALVAVFAPLAFLTGTTGRLFNEFGVSMAGAVLLSGFVALTLTPMLCAKILRVPTTQTRFDRAMGRALQRLSDAYARALARALGRRWWVVAGGGALSAAAALLFLALDSEFIPPEDRGSFTAVVLAPEGATLAYTDRYQRRIEGILQKTEGVEHVFGIAGPTFLGGPSRGIIFTDLVDWDERTRTVQDVIDEVQPRFFGVPGVLAFANNPPALGGFSQPVQFVVQHADFDQLVKGMDALVARARAIPGLVNVDTDLRVNKPELSIVFDRDRAEDVGVPVRDVATTLQTLLGGRDVATFTRQNKLYDVIVRTAPDARATPLDVSALSVRGRDGGLVQLDAVTRVTEGVGPRQLNHFQRVRSFTLTANLAPGFPLGPALEALDAAAAEALPPGSSTALSGESRDLRETGSALYVTFGLAILIVFMVLASQFESLAHPFTVLTAVPLAVTGALLTLWLTGSTLNLYSQIALILLVGLVCKNSILLVNYANQERAAGKDTLAAMIEAGRIRLRPILMTSAAATTGALPIALGLGAGSASRRPMGYAIVGGLLVSTLLTLFLVPAVYVVVDGLQARLAARRARRAAGPSDVNVPPALRPAEAP